MNYRVDVRFFPAPPDLQGCFATFYRGELNVAGGGRITDLLQPEWGNVRFFSGDCPDARIPGGDRLSGARFTATGSPLTSTRFFVRSTVTGGPASRRSRLPSGVRDFASPRSTSKA